MQMAFIQILSAVGFQRREAIQERRRGIGVGEFETLALHVRIARRPADRQSERPGRIADVSLTRPRRVAKFPDAFVKEVPADRDLQRDQKDTGEEAESHAVNLSFMKYQTWPTPPLWHGQETVPQLVVAGSN